PGPERAPEPTSVPHQHTPAQAPDTGPAPPAPGAVPATPTPTIPSAAPVTPPASEAGPSPAYLALARLGRADHRLALSADDCAALEPRAAEWLDRGVTVDYLTSALTAGLPAKVDSPLGFLRRRLTDKMPPRLPTAESPSPGIPAPARQLLVECADCGHPGPPQALPDGLCRPCRTAHSGAAEDSPRPSEIADVKAHMSNLRDLLRSV
ncbi:MarR family transcriptional regulator, partial [Streptomyces sp. NPDC051640]